MESSTLPKTEFFAVVRIHGKQARVTIPKEHWESIHNLKDGDLCRFTIEKSKKGEIDEGKM